MGRDSCFREYEQLERTSCSHLYRKEEKQADQNRIGTWFYGAIRGILLSVVRKLPDSSDERLPGNGSRVR